MVVIGGFFMGKPPERAGGELCVDIFISDLGAGFSTQRHSKS
jgi:hypothetical protein